MPDPDADLVPTWTFLWQSRYTETEAKSNILAETLQARDCGNLKIVTSVADPGQTSQICNSFFFLPAWISDTVSDPGSRIQNQQKGGALK
jgi:hypothetical protein